MNNKYAKNVRAAFAVLGLAAVFTACSAKVSGGGGDNPLPNPLTPPAPKSNPQPAPPKPVPFPTTCTNYSGTYQMNDSYFQLVQTGCSKLDWTNLATYDQPAQSTVSYIPDGITRNEGGIQESAYFKGVDLYMETKDSNNDDIVQKFTFQTAPCNLANPDGQNYLTIETWVNGQYAQDLCSFYSKQPSQP